MNYFSIKLVVSRKIRFVNKHKNNTTQKTIRVKSVLGLSKRSGFESANNSGTFEREPAQNGHFLKKKPQKKQKLKKGKIFRKISFALRNRTFK